MPRYPVYRPFWAVAIAALLLQLLTGHPAAAQAQTLAQAPDAAIPPGLLLDPVVVSATRLPTPESNLASSLTVITAPDIAAKQERTLPDALQDVPGLNVVQTGGPGGVTSVFIRGTNSNHTKVYVDGVDVSDPSLPNGGYDLAHILTAPLEQVEVLRGPQSGLYGSDAIGGVINIITQSGSGPPVYSALIEGGALGTFNQNGAVRGATDRFNYAFDVEHYHAGSVPVTPLDLLPPGQQRINNSYDNKTFGTKLGAKLTDTIDVGLVGRYIYSDINTTGDDFSVFPAVPANAQTYGEQRQLITRGTVHQTLLDGMFDHTFGLGYVDHRNENTSPGAPGTYTRGDRVKADWQGNLRFAPGEVLTLGAEHQLDEIRDSPISAQNTLDAGFVQLQSNYADRFFNALSLRYDSNSQFGGKLTYRVAPAYLIPETGTKLKGTVGTGFKAPTLNQLYVSFPAFNFFANPNLRAETSLGYDLGFEQKVPSAPVTFGGTYFHNHIDDLITTNATFTTNININQATTQGVEAFLEARPFESVVLRANYTYTLADDDVLHQELLRRPRHKASLDARWQFNDKTLLTTNLLYVGSWADVDRTGANTGFRTTPYLVVNLTGSYDLGGGFTAFARINNLFNRNYQDPTGFLHPGLSGFCGVKVAFDGPVTL